MGRGLQTSNHSSQRVLWSERVEDCRSSGLTVSQWCQGENIPLSSYYSWKRKLFQKIMEPEAVCFAEVAHSPPTSEKILATLHGNGIRIELHVDATSGLIRNLVDALKSC